MGESNKHNSGLDRRRLLQLTGASTVSGAIAALAGCADDQDQAGDTDTPTSGDGNGDDDDGGQDMSEDEQSYERVPEIHFVTWPQSGYPGIFEASRITTTNLEELGLTVELDPQQFPQPLIASLFEERDFDMTAISFLGSSIRIDPSFYLNTVLHSSSGEPGGWNFAGWENEEFDALAEEQLATFDQEARRELVYEAQKIAYDEQAMTTYTSPSVPIGLNTDRYEQPSASEMVPGEELLDVYTITNIEPKGSDTVFTLASIRDNFGTLNPTQVTEAGVNEFIRPMYDTLMRVGPQGRPEPWIIDDISSEDETTVTIQLMDGLQFHDGEPLTAEDVKFSFEYHSEHQSPYYSQFIDVIDSIETSGEREITLSLTQPYSPLQSLTLSIVPVLPKHIWEERSQPSNHQNVPAIGSGPFEFERHESGSVLELTANKDHPQAPAVDGLLIQLFGNNSSAQQSLLQGDVDGMAPIPTSLHGEVENSDSVTLFFKPSHSIETITHNIRKGMPFEDIAFRRAVAHAIPNEGIAEQIHDGHADPGGSIIARANEFWHNPDIGYLEYDIEKAKSILEDAGYKWDDNGRLMMPVSE